MTRVFHRQLLSQPPIAVSGEGVYIRDSQGSLYLDASAGAAVSSLGHNHPDVIRAIKRQLDNIPFAHSGFFSNLAMEELGTYLAERAPGSLNYVYFVGSGSEAMEAAIKLARQYFVEIGLEKRQFIISRKQSYHGSTLGALSVGGNFARRKPFMPLLADAHHIAPCYAYRHQRSGESIEEYAVRAAEELEVKIQEIGAERIIGFVAEPVVGATLGAVPAPPGYFRRVREICNKYDILLILDEVMCGMGRTGTLFASEQEDIVADLLTTAKGLGAGYQPIGALLVDEKIYQAILQGSGAFQHGHTYVGHAASCAGALAVMKVIERDHLLNQVIVLGRQLRKMLVQRFARHPHIGDIRGRGLLLALEFVLDKRTKAPFPSELRLDQVLKSSAMQEGLICYSMAGTIDGTLGNHVLIAPPFIISESQIVELVEKLGAAVDNCLSKILTS
ncbi:MAG: aspartate aminotransferase family protein [Acidiferrobacteraceae bacterium]|nr:aspartate aminotransferase family protein [Acidiferrobacteraceae bacterium]